jgi:hypothetical protein
MRRFVLLVFAVLFLAIPFTARADVRPYTWSYGYITPYKGEFEIESWCDFNKGDESNFISPKVELEYGITDHWVAELNGVFEKEGAESWASEVQLEQRYRLFEPGTLPVDTTLYLEYAHNFKEKQDELEGKIILSKDFGNFNATANLVVEHQFEADNTVYSYSAGVSYPVFQKVTPALEVFGEWEGSESQHFIGPSILIYAGQATAINAGAGIGYTKGSDDFRARIILSHQVNIF